ncbi:hypothetical protein GCG54_00007621 [Colletotrichum gloeosporioides]|uniref:Orc1-like AAA ATPase domain-containing protein n=1 Tax=Colletotrichum gloeosporioides TaxID=474922 RepID=A0A8H4CPW2_COLGL|nr:uncharacterized protein GCG54_00007621 [Colletotrichum gloeosporioides]KAF3807885.1 hypothetical protein GCG54_00007621 [Colletotrichum gloeosporioides]
MINPVLTVYRIVRPKDAQSFLSVTAWAVSLSKVYGIHHRTCRSPSQLTVTLTKALLHAEMGRSGHLEEQKLIKTSTFAVFFMGTPHQGGEGLSILDAVTRVLSLVSYTNLALIEKIKPNSDWLLDIQERYSAISRDFRTICGYELRETYTTVRGRLLLVPKASAILFAATNILALPFDADHVTMVKFSGADDPNFQKIIKRIELFSRLAVDDAASFGTVNAGDKGKCHDKKGWDKIYTSLLNLANMSQHKAIRADEILFEDNTDVATPLEFSLGVTFQVRWNRHFTGRNSTLQLLKRMLAPSSTQDTFPLVVLYGPGGIGKTQLALQYARHGKDHYSSIFWIDGTHPDTIETSVIACVERLKDHYVSHGLQNTSPRYGLLNGSSTAETLENPSSTARSPIDRFLSWLSYRENTQWLLIIDNVDDLESVNLRDLLPTTRWGAVLVTSRRSDLAISWDSIEVPGMNKDEAFALLQQNSKLVLTKGTEDFDVHLLNINSLAEWRNGVALTRRLAYLPLAISQAGAHIAMQQSKNPISTYLALYTKYPRNILGKRTVHLEWDRRQDTVLATWEISFNEIKKRMPEAAEILLLCGFFPPQFIVAEFYIRGSSFTGTLYLFNNVLALKNLANPSSKEIQVLDSLSLLRSFSLLQYDPHKNRYSIHPLIHLWARLRLGTEEHEAMLQQALSILHNYGNPQEYLQHERHLFNILSKTESHSCESSPEEVVGLMSVEPYNNEPPIFSFLDHLTGWTLWLRAYCNEAAWFIFEAIFGQSNRRLYDWEIIHRLASGGRHTDALSWALCNGMKVFPPKHPRILEIVGNYAFSMIENPWNHERREDALRWYTWLLSARFLVLGPMHPATAGAYLGLGMSHDNCTIAIRSSTTAFDIRYAILGKDDFLTQNADRALNETKNRCFLSECSVLNREAQLQKLMSAWRRDMTRTGLKLHDKILDFEIMEFDPHGPLASLPLIVELLEKEGREFLRSWPSSVAHFAAHFRVLKASHDGSKVTEQLTHIWQEELQETGLSIEPMVQMSQIAFYLAAWCMEARDVQCAESWLSKLYLAPQDRMSLQWHKKCTWPLDLYPRLWFEYSSPLKGDIEEQLSYWIDGAFWYLASSIMGQLAGFHLHLMSNLNDDFSIHIEEATLLFLLPGMRQTASTDLYFAEFLSLLGEYPDDITPAMKGTIEYWESRGQRCPGMLLRDSIVDNLYGDSLRDSIGMRSFKDSRVWYMCLAA